MQKFYIFLFSTIKKIIQLLLKPSSLHHSDEWQIWELFMPILLYSQSFCSKTAERTLPRKYFSYLILFETFDSLV